MCSNDGIKSSFWFELHTKLSSFQQSWDQILRNKRDTLKYCSEVKLDPHAQEILREWCVCQNIKVNSSNYSICVGMWKKRLFGSFMNWSSTECSTKKMVRLCKLGVCWQAVKRSTTYKPHPSLGERQIRFQSIWGGFLHNNNVSVLGIIPKIFSHLSGHSTGV